MGSNSLAYIGLAHRAGKTITGSAAVEKGLHQAKIQLLLLQDTLSDSSIRHFRLVCERYRVVHRVIPGELGIGAAVGRVGIKVVGITDRGLADTIKNIIDGGQGSGN